MKILKGEEASVSEGLNFALSRMPEIFSWTVISATVGTLLQILHNTGKLGEIVSALIGVTWSILSFFVVPILIYEDKSVFDSIKASGLLVKEKWGESLTGNFSFGLFYILGVAGAFFTGMFLMNIHPVLGVLTMVGLFLLVATVMSAAKTVFIAALYNHVNGFPVGDFSGETLDSIFIPKK